MLFILYCEIDKINKMESDGKNKRFEVAKDSVLLGYYTVSLGKCFQALRDHSAFETL